MRLHCSTRSGRLLVLAYRFAALTIATACSLAASQISGRVLDPQGGAVSGATVRLLAGSAVTAVATTNVQGEFRLESIAPGHYRLTAEALGFQTGIRNLDVAGETGKVDLTLPGIAGQHQSIVITAKTVEPSVDLRNAEVFNRTLFTRDDQVMQQVNAGIDAGQHEGGGKSVEVRRFGFNLDHGGANGGLKVLVDDE